MALMQAIAPEMAEAMARRAMVLTAIAESAPVGRRQLALRLNLAEREVRADVEKLRDAGLITLDKAGMNPTPNASRWLESARSFARQTQGLTALETALMQVLPVKTVFVAPGDADADVRVLSDVGGWRRRACGNCCIPGRRWQSRAVRPSRRRHTPCRAALP